MPITTRCFAPQQAAGLKRAFLQVLWRLAECYNTNEEAH
jgi:hypothetical protein